MHTLWSAGLVFVTGASLTQAQDAQQKSPDAASASACFEIVAPPPDRFPAGNLLLNKCTGTTWMLVREQLKGNRGAWQWSPLRTNQDEPTFPMPEITPAK